MLLDHCYTFGLLLWPSNSEEVVFWRQHQIMSKTRHQNGTKKNNNTSSQMLLDHCYTFGLLLWPSNSEEVVLWRRALIDLLWPCPRSTTVRICPKSQYKCVGVMSTPKCL